MDEQELFSAEQAQERLGVSRATLWSLIKRYRIPRYTIPLKGKRLYFKPADLGTLGEAREKATA